MNLPPLSGPSYLAQSLVYDRPVVMEDQRSPSAAPHPFPPEGALSSQESVTKKIEEIAGNPNLTDKQKRAQINELRKQLGISKGDMKKLYMKPLEKKAELEGDETKRKLYASMYKPGGCVKKVFKGIGKGLATVGKVALGVAAAVFNPMSLIPVIGQIPMVGKIVNSVTGALSRAKSAVDATVDKVAGWVDKGVGTFERGVETYRRVSELPRRWMDEAKEIFWSDR